MRSKEEIEEALSLCKKGYADLKRLAPEEDSITRSQACIVDTLNWVLGNHSAIGENLGWMRKMYEKS